MRVTELMKHLESLPPNAEVRVIEYDGAETRNENFWLVDVEYRHRVRRTIDVHEVALIGME